MKTDRNITLKDGTNLTLKDDTNLTLKDDTNLTLLNKDNILIIGKLEQSRYEEEIKEIDIAEFLIRIIVFWFPLIAIGIYFIIYILSGCINFRLITVISIIIWGIFGYFFINETFPNVTPFIAEYKINNDKKKTKSILLKQKLNIVKKDKGFNEIFKCMYGLVIIGGIMWISLLLELLETIYLYFLLRISIVFFLIFIIILCTILYTRYIVPPLNKPPEEVFPEWKYIGHMSANKLILICLMISAVPALVIYSLWKIFLYLVGVFF